MASNYKVNCFILGDEEIFSIEIAPTETIASLKYLIKEAMKHAFDGVDPYNLQLFMAPVSLSIEALEHDLNRLLFDLKKSLSPLAKMNKVFCTPPNRKELHIIVLPPPDAVHLTFALNCLVLGSDPSNLFPIKIQRAKTVAALRYVIKDAMMHIFRDVAAESLVLWRVDLSADDTLEHNLNSLGFDRKGSLSPAVTLFRVFATFPQGGHLHIVVQPPPAVPVATNIPVDERYEYLENDTEAPSIAGIPQNFSRMQEKKEFLCTRPHEASGPVPVTLLEPIFAQFVDDCQNYQPTAEDNSFIWRLSEKMCDLYEDENKRMIAFREMLLTYGIDLRAGNFDSSGCRTDGHMLSHNGFVQIIANGKDKFSNSSAEPFLQSSVYYRKFCRHSRDKIRVRRLIAPCFFIVVFGACIGIVGSVLTHKVECDILVPIIPLFCHFTDTNMQAMAARTFGALKIAIKKLETLYSNFESIPPLKHGDPTIRYPYPTSYTDGLTGHSQAFSYDWHQTFIDRLIFFGKTVNNAAQQKICIKFIKHYSRKAHEFCASKGHAPKLIAYEPLSGGWNMVVMEALEINNGKFPQFQGPYRKFRRASDCRLEGVITFLIRELHNYGYVHGDIRDVNFFVRGDHFMLLDFDWAGPIDQTYYPAHVNYWEVRRPEGARDGKKILVEHDLAMLKYLFHPEQTSKEITEGEEPAAKHRRTSSNPASGGGEGLAMDVGISSSSLV